VIALLGDTHLPRGSRRLPERCVELLRRAELIVHTGDFATISVLRELELLGSVAAVHGNMDDAALHAVLPTRRVVEHGDLRIGLVHDAGARAGRHERLVGWFPDCDVIAYGHTHVPDITQHQGHWIVNPGSPTERRRAPTRAMAVIERGRPRIVELDEAPQ
jgi:putative phosphoesterase